MSEPVRIPADVDRPDRLLAGLTGRQVAILAVAAMLLYAAWSATRTLIPAPVFLVLAVPVAAATAAVALGTRDGLPADRLLLAAVRQRLAPRRQVAAPDGIQPAPGWLTARAVGDTAAVRAGRLRLPAQAVTASRGAGAGEVGVVDLGPDGLAVVAATSTVNFALRTAAEQEALVAVFARYLHSLTAPVQILVRAERLDLTAQISELRGRAPALPHPALEAAALEHADYLTQLAADTDLLRRQILLILREPLPTPTPAGRRARGRDQVAARAAAARAAQTRLARRLAEAVDLLAPAGIVVTGLDPAQATAVLAAACNPDTLIRPGPGLAAADEVITTAPTGADDDPPTAVPADRRRRPDIDDDPDDPDEDEEWDEDDWADEENDDDEDSSDGPAPISQSPQRPWGRRWAA